MMHKNSHLRIAACLVSAIFLLMVSMGFGQGKDNSGNPSPVGTWFGYAEGPGYPPIWMMPTFFADGNVIANDSIDLFAPAPHSTAHGTWKWTHAKQFEATFYWLNLDPGGLYLGSNKVVLSGEINPKNRNEIINGKIIATIYPESCGNPLRPKDGCVPVQQGVFLLTELLRAQ
jgi:hypothetical protein